MHLENYANDGLRTLVIAYKDIKESEYKSWKVQYDDAQLDLRHKESRLAEINDIIESGLILIGATAIEDKLQTGVCETIKFMKEAGIKTWILTGDKLETAINIGFSCGLFTEEILRIYITARKTLDIKQELIKGLKTIKINDVRFGLVVTGPVSYTHLTLPTKA